MPDHTSYSEAFSPFVPGFEFLQGLVKNAGQTLPNIGQWVAPTLDPAELERRIHELRTVQFWLEQNARMIGTTVQALEVQRMTLGTLRSMNVQMGDLSEALKMRPMAEAAPAPAPSPAPTPAPASASAPDAADADAAPAVDPMQWWGALTQQFTQLATQAVQATTEAATQAQAASAAAAAAAATAAATTAATATAPAPSPAAKAAPRKSPARKSTKV